MNEKVLEIVDKICSMPTLDCRGLNKSAEARRLLDMKHVPAEANIVEIPLCWDRQVVINFEIPNDFLAYSLFAGIGTDKKYYFYMYIDGIWDEDELLSLGDNEEGYDKEIKLNDDFFIVGFSDTEQQNVAKELLSSALFWDNCAVEFAQELGRNDDVVIQHKKCALRLRTAADIIANRKDD